MMSLDKLLRMYPSLYIQVALSQERAQLGP